MTGGENPKQKDKEKQKSHYTQTFQMFRENKSLTQVVGELDIDAKTVIKYYEDY